MRPVDNLHKLVLSCPAHFTAEYELHDFILTTAWSFDTLKQRRDSPLYRSYFLLAFQTPYTGKAPGLVIPDYSPTGDIMAAYLSVLFGKRFDHHGAIEMSGGYRIPNMSSASEMCPGDRPYHGSGLRADFPTPLDLRQVGRLQAIIDAEPVDQKLSEAFKTSALFYARALRAVSRDAEVAYLHLITACERLAEVAPLDDFEVESVIRTALQRIETELLGGERIARQLRTRMRSLRRRFATLISTHVDEGFLSRTEAGSKWDAFQPSDFPRAATAAYDLRSQYVHTGASFGQWITPDYSNAERLNGRPMIPDKRMQSTLARAPTFIGLERLTRFVLLKCAEKLGADLSSSTAYGDVSDSAAGD